MSVKTDLLKETLVFLEIWKLKHHLKFLKTASLVLYKMPVSFSSWSMKQLDKSLFWQKCSNSTVLCCTPGKQTNLQWENHCFLEGVIVSKCVPTIYFGSVLNLSIGEGYSFYTKITCPNNLPVWHSGLKTHSN